MTKIPMMFFLVTTDHLEDRIWFRNDDDFKMGMNLVAVISYRLSVNILAFILMTNHVHFVLECTYGQARVFINEYKKAYSRYLSHKYSTKETLRNNDIDIQALDMNDESLERAIAYVQMNSVAANICLTPTEYPWGTGNAFFSKSIENCRQVGDISGRERIRMFHCKKDIPDNCLVGNGGYILPASYVKVSFVESLFRTPKRMMFFLQNSSKAKKRLGDVMQEGPSFKDQVIVAAMGDLIRTLFRKDSLHSLSVAEQTEILRQIRYRFSASIDQIARVTGFNYNQVVELLETL